MHREKRVNKKLVSGKVVLKAQVAAGHFRMSILCPHISQNSCPGQFILVRVNASYDPILCRPLAIYKVRGDVFDILFEVVGMGTRLLSEKRVGDVLNIIGPLGTCFPIDGDFQVAMLVAGGMGIAALMRLAESMADRQTITLIGASTQSRIVGREDLMALDVQVHIATEDGSAGYKGKVPELLREILSKGSFSSVPCRIYACGPAPMLKVVAQIANEYKIPAYVSLEERMACGVGACMGCVCQVVSPEGVAQYKTVCADGPVFDAQEIIWN